jgi:histone deacetylase 1/2
MGANQHVTPDLASMTSSEPYTSSDQLHVGNGKGLVISHIAHSKLYTPKHTFILSNVLHVPHIKKPLLFVQKFCIENNVFFEFHSSMFYVKDLITKEVLLSGQSRDGLYVLSESSATFVHEAFLSTSVSSTADVWHRHFGHPSSHILGSLISNNKVACISRVFNFSCSSCPLGKASCLSLGLTGHKTCAPLELVFSDVWGPSPMLSTYGYRYFVIFVDAYSKYI